MRFKGFGTPKPRTPSFKQIVENGLRVYEDAKCTLSIEPDTSRLLARQVMKFAGGNEDKDIKFGRVCLGQLIIWFRQNVPQDTDATMFGVLSFIDTMTTQEIASFQQDLLANA